MANLSKFIGACALALVASTASASAADPCACKGAVTVADGVCHSSLSAAIDSLPETGGTVKIGGKKVITSPVKFSKKNVAIVGERYVLRTSAYV